MASSDLFDGLTFWMAPQPAKAAVARLIQEHGGVMATQYRPDAITLVHGRQCPPGHNPTCSAVYSDEFIDDCIHRGCIVDVNKYEVLAGDAPNPARPKRGRTEYTDLDDYKLLRYFEENNGRDSIKFFREMSLGCDLGRTPQSLRNRYRALKNMNAAARAQLDERVEAHLERCEQRKSSFVRNVNEARVERPEPADIVFDENLPVNVERNGKGELDPDSPEAIVERLGEEFNQPTEVILHALIIHSGNVDRARQYLSGATTVSSWEVAEDEILAHPSDAEEELRELHSYRPDDEIADRRDFLRGLSS
ncbi:BRCT domain-containing protein [Plasmodiophora brassicae]|uniref:BRCT domain-containing protein n=1 Tax=Plasmodiophora brassicae TaxID=37360 RepID=A0A0G4IZ17_PLABS|nr:hypothetical protein PBRA_001408 [Plasmodiophora brassicae]SPQ94137.1 unnamed protein product [Plasmodiophora brassicae]